MSASDDLGGSLHPRTLSLYINSRLHRKTLSLSKYSFIYTGFGFTSGPTRGRKAACLPPTTWGAASATPRMTPADRDFFIDNLLVQIHEMILVDRPCAIGVGIPFSRYPNIFLFSDTCKYHPPNHKIFQLASRRTLGHRRQVKGPRTDIS